MHLPVRLLSCSLAVCSAWAADVALPAVFSDHMVLQQGQKIPVWGTSAAGETITVTFGGQSVSTTASAAGTWRVELDKMAATAQPHQLRIAGHDTVTFQDVLVGEVWFCSGQSNMAMTVADANNAAQEIAAADHPQVRVFHTMLQSRIRQPETWDAGAWEVCTPQNAPQFSAVGYYFARRLQQQLQVPVGIVVSAIGGTSATRWLSPESLTADPALSDLQTQFTRQIVEYPPALDTRGWQAPGYADAAWKTMSLPTAWEKSGQGMDQLDGAVWFRREVVIPASWAGHPATLNLGPVDDGDTVYVNGQRIGGMNVDTPLVWTLPRHYPVPAAGLTPGRVVIAMRITDQLGDGGVVGTPEQMHLTLDGAPSGAADSSLPLAGAWKYAIEERWPSHQIATTLYTGMVAPWTRVPIAGVVWYQGEADAGNPPLYHHLLADLIGGWRTAWKRPDLPFEVVQLPEFGMPVADPANSGWAGLREAQAVVVSTTPHSGLTVTLGLGEPNDIHPKNKQDVGLRVAQLALAEVYHQEGTHAGPTCTRAELDGATFRLHFINVGSGLRAADGVLKGFAVAGADHRFVWADARIDGAAVLVSNASVTAPIALRYAWADSPAATLSNAEGFPAAPFRCEGSSVIPRISGTP